MCLDQQIGRNIKAYIDDVVVKSKTADNLIADLEETFANLKRYRWKLNPSKCIFGVPSSILLGYIVVLEASSLILIRSPPSPI